MTQTTRSKLGRAGKGEQGLAEWTRGRGMDEPADIQARPYGGMFCERAGLFLFISPARLLATFISRLCCSTCILWWWRRLRSFSAAPKSAGTNNKSILLAPQEGVEEVCVLQCTRVIINICFEPSFFFFFSSRAHTQFDLICIFPARITLAAYLSNTCHLGRKRKILNTLTITEGDKSARWRCAD